MLKALCRLPSDQSGATSIEYGVIAALVGVTIIPAVSSVGQRLLATFFSLAGGF